MRDFEETDFDFDFEEDGVKSLDMKGFREDSYPSLTFGTIASRKADLDRQARIEAYRERVQKEMKRLKEIGIKV